MNHKISTLRNLNVKEAPKILGQPTSGLNLFFFSNNFTEVWQENAEN